jgi:hypothetical protein
MELYISEVTVKSHINHLFAKTGSRSRAEAVRYAYDHGLVAPRRETVSSLRALIPSSASTTQT